MVVCPIRTRIKFFKEEGVERRLLGEGEVLVKKGQVVKSNDLIAKVKVREEPLVFDLPQLLKAKKPFSKKHLLKKKGEKVEKGEKLVYLTSFFGARRTLIAPCEGKILGFKENSGQLIFQPEAKEELQMQSLFWGQVEKVGKETVVLKSNFLDIFGVAGAGEAFGEILICDNQLSNPSLFDGEGLLKEKIFVFRGSPGGATLEKLKIRDAGGVICGGLRFRDFQSCRKSRLPLLIIEGFGKLRIGGDLLEILKKYEGKKALLEGEERRLRVPLEKIDGQTWGKETETETETERELKIGDKVRLVGEPGPVSVQGKVLEIDKKKTLLESGFRAVLVKIKAGDEVLELPSNNLEIIKI